MTGLDAANATFWDELCGSALARSIGVTDGSPASLRRFDDAYMGLYPYLRGHLDPILRRKGRTLEIGLGYGTVSALIASSGADLHGLDIAQGPVDMVRGRLAQLGQGSAPTRLSKVPRSRFPGRIDTSTRSSRSAACTTRATWPSALMRSRASSPQAGSR